MGRSMRILRCETCGVEFKRWEAWAKKTKRHFCSRECSAEFHRGKPGKKQTEEMKARLSAQRWGANNPMWKGNDAGIASARERAQRRFPDMGICQRCGAAALDRHHKDGNVHNNKHENIEFLCRRCHMKVDGRLDVWLSSYCGRVRNAEKKSRSKRSTKQANTTAGNAENAEKK